jgi:hypothetical protein
MVPEEQAVELYVLNTLSDGIFERVEDVVEIIGVGEF